jgi:predicted dienelactone hydrolase
MGFGRQLGVLWVLAGLVACGDDSASDGPRDAALDASADAAAPRVVGYTPRADPRAPGPFRVGVTRRTVPYTGVDGGSRPLDAVIWYPTEGDSTEDRDLGGLLDAPLAPQGPFALLAFSHGNGGEPNQSRYQVMHLASHGFVVIAPAHPGSRGSECGFSCSGTQTADSAANRPGEILASIDFALEEANEPGALLEGAASEARLGILGHSFGGFTTLGVLGGESRGRLLAGLAMAPAAHPGAAPLITAPMMLMVAEVDTLVSIASARTTYERIPADTRRHLLWFANAGHFAYNDACILGCSDADSLDQDLAHTLINTYGTAFLQKYVGLADDHADLLQPDPDIADGEARLEVGELTF